MNKLLLALCSLTMGIVLSWCVFCAGYCTAMKQNAAELSNVYACEGTMASFLSSRLRANDVAKVQDVLHQQAEFDAFLHKQSDQSLSRMTYRDMVLHPKEDMMLFSYDPAASIPACGHG
jgi:hypothetical protein